MYGDLSRLTRTITPVLDIDTVKQHLLVVDDDSDDLISFYIDSATDYIDGISGIGLSLLTTTWSYSLDHFYNRMVIPMYPVQSIESIEYRDITNTWNTVDPSVYYVDVARSVAAITLNYNCFYPQVVLPPGKCVRINFTAGYGDTPALVPNDIKYAMMLLIGSWFENRSAVVGIDSRDSPAETPLGFEAIISKYRVASFA